MLILFVFKAGIFKQSGFNNHFIIYLLGFTISTFYSLFLANLSWKLLTFSDEMLNAENANLRDRVCELERKVQSQEDELV